MNSDYLKAARNFHPTIHCLTNYVTAGSVANVILAAGGSPIMSDHPDEVSEVAGICDGLLLNLGTLKPGSPEAMKNAGRKANELGRPVLLDPVGIGSSSHRLETALDLLANVRCQVIRGNASEIRLLSSRLNSFGERAKNLADPSPLFQKGAPAAIDASPEDQLTSKSLEDYLAAARRLSISMKAVVAVTGAVDLVTDGEHSFLIRNGHPMMARITGAGCMLDGLISVLLAAQPFQKSSRGLAELTALAIAFFGACGEAAYAKTVDTRGGTASFQTFLIDAVSMADDDFLERRTRIEFL